MIILVDIVAPAGIRESIWELNHLSHDVIILTQSHNHYDCSLRNCSLSQGQEIELNVFLGNTAYIIAVIKKSK
jgi:hypothetical protein